MQDTWWAVLATSFCARLCWAKACRLQVRAEFAERSSTHGAAATSDKSSSWVKVESVPNVSRYLRVRELRCDKLAKIGWHEDSIWINFDEPVILLQLMVVHVEQHVVQLLPQVVIVVIPVRIVQRHHPHSVVHP